MKKVWILPIVLAVVMIATGIWGYGEYRAKNDYHQYLDNMYQKSFYDVVKSVENIEVCLSKLMVTGSPQQRMLMLNEVWNKATIAHNSLGQLPISHLALDRTSSFINQVGDYCYYLARETGNGRTFTEEEWTKLEKLHNYAAELNKDLNKLEHTIAKDGIKWGEIRLAGRRAMEETLENDIDERFNTIEKNMVDYPELIYDGPFSEHMAKREPKGLTGDELSFEQAKAKVLDFVGEDKVREIRKTGEVNGTFQTYSMEVLPKNEEKSPIYVDITKKGGHIVWVLTPGITADKKTSVQEGIGRAEKWLEEKGFENMIPTYNEVFNGRVLINFAYEQDDVIVYPDLIKVEVSLEDSEIVGFEAAGFIMSHHERRIPEPDITENEARARLSSRYDVESVRKAIIPTPGGNERLCYEFKGKFHEETFLIYIDALTGEEINIFKLIDTDAGQLTI